VPDHRRARTAGPAAAPRADRPRGRGHRRGDRAVHPPGRRGGGDADTSDTPNLAAALAAVQAQLPEIRKGETAVVPTKSGGKYTFSYANLADVSKVVQPLVIRHGLAWITQPTTRDGRFVLAYELRHVSGEAISGEYPLPDRGKPQEIGSAITFARRYTLCSVTGV